MHSEALGTMLAALGISDVAAADIAIAKGLARQLDDAPYAEPEIWREYRFAVRNLREVLGGDNASDTEITDLIDRLGGTAPRDTSDTKPGD